MPGLEWKAEFSGKRVLITGACGTLGGWLAGHFAGAGAGLALSDVRGEELDALASKHRVSAEGGLVHRTDLTDDASLADLTETVRRMWGAPDIVINNAGVYPAADLLDTSNALWDRVFDVNLRALFIVSRDMARLMREAGQGGAIINIASGGARVLRYGLIPYCVSKGAVERLTRGFALELGPLGIRVNAVSPGFMPQAVTSEETKARHSRVTPLGRYARDGDATTAVLYLASSAASFVTGTMIDTDGGYTLTAAAIDAASNANNAGHARYLDRS